MPWIDAKERVPNVITFAYVKVYLTEKIEKAIIKSVGNNVWWAEGNGFWFSIPRSRILKWWEDEPQVEK